MTPRILNGPYLPHPNEDMVVGWASIGRDVLIAGPAGVGKSMLLEHVAEQLKSKAVSCLVQLSRKENMRRITPQIMLQHVADRMAHEAALQANAGSFSQAPPETLIINVVKSLAGRRVILVVDGLDMLYHHPDALDFFGALGDLPEEVTIVTAVPWKCVLGPRTEPLVRFGERFIPLDTVDVDFLRSLLTSRMTDADKRIPEDCFRLAAYSCGYIPRVFLQIIQSALGYARLGRGDHSPADMTDVEDALLDQEDSWRRCLLPGDVAQLIQHDGSDGLELDLPTKIRFLSHGMMLEREEETETHPVLQVHPLLRSFCFF